MDPPTPDVTKINVDVALDLKNLKGVVAVSFSRLNQKDIACTSTLEAEAVAMREAILLDSCLGILRVVWSLTTCKDCHASWLVATNLKVSLPLT